jgi:hypothetical protein
MSAVAGKFGELGQRGAAYGAELAAALALAGERANGDGRIVKQMAEIAVREIRSAVDYLREGGLPDAIVGEYEFACRKGFRDELLKLTGRVHVEDTTDAGRVAA